MTSRMIFGIGAAIIVIALILIAWPAISSALTNQTTKEVKQQQSIPFQVETKQDGGLASGQRVTDQKGQTGTKEVKYKVTLKNGKEIGRKVDSEKILTQPKNEIDRVGTAPVSDSLDATPQAGRNTVWEALVLLALIVGGRLYGRSARELHRAASHKSSS